MGTACETRRYIARKDQDRNPLIDRYSKNVVRGRGRGSNGIEARQFQQGIYEESEFYCILH